MVLGCLSFFCTASLFLQPHKSSLKAAMVESIYYRPKQGAMEIGGRQELFTGMRWLLSPILGFQLSDLSYR